MDAIVPQSFDRSATRLAQYQADPVSIEAVNGITEADSFAQELNQARRTTQLAQKHALARTPGDLALPQALQESIDRTAQDMETLFVGQLLKAMWKTIPESEYGMKGSPGEIYRDMFIDQVAEMSSEGRGIGLKQIIREEMMERESGKRINL